MGPIMNGNCLRVSSYFGRNRIFVTYSIMVDPSIIVTNVLELLLCVLLHCVDAGVAVTQLLYRCCESKAVATVTSLILLLSSFGFFYLFWTVRVHNVVQHHIWITSHQFVSFASFGFHRLYTHSNAYAKAHCSTVYYAFVVIFSLVLRFFSHFLNVPLFAIWIDELKTKWNDVKRGLWWIRTVLYGICVCVRSVL